jgi:hypothetical protein
MVNIGRNKTHESVGRIRWYKSALLTNGASELKSSLYRRGRLAILSFSAFSFIVLGMFLLFECLLHFLSFCPIFISPIDLKHMKTVQNVEHGCQGSPS